MREPSLWEILTVVTIEAVVVGGSAVIGAGVGGVLGGASWPPNPAVVGAILGPFVAAFFRRFRKRLDDLNEAVGLHPINGNTNGGE